MAVREVLRYPHPALKVPAREVEPDSAEAARVAADLVDTMRAFPRCVGVAAPQLDEAVRMLVVDVSAHPKAPPGHHGLLVLVNPRVLSSEGSEVAREGCLSIPDFTADVRRAARVELEAWEPGGPRRVLEAEGFEARCLLHELDHLDGILFLDRVESPTQVFRRKRYG